MQFLDLLVGKKNLMNKSKIAFIGPESSGKTSLAEECARLFNGIYIPEFAREYLSSKGDFYKYSIDDLLFIAEKQFESFKKPSGKILFIDTEMIVMSIWAKDKFGFIPDKILKLTANQQIDKYYLCKPDFPWQFDKLREDPGRQNDIFDLYKLTLDSYNINYEVLFGDFGSRIKKIELFLSSDKL